MDYQGELRTDMGMPTSDAPRLDRLGRAMRERRIELGLTQSQLAERLGWAQERISVLENGKYGMPSVPALVRLASVLEVPFSSLLEAAGYRDLGGAAEGGPDAAANVTLRYALQRLLAINALNVGDALDEASDLLVEAMGAEKVDAFLYEQDNDSLLAIGTSNTPMGRRQHELGLDREPIANGGRTVEAYQTGRWHYSPQADTDPEMVRGTVVGLGIRSYLVVPFKAGDAIVGVLAAASTHPDRFGEEECRFFEAVANWVGMVARRAQLTESLTSAAAAEARRLAAEELVTLLAHDLGNALTPLKGRLDMMRRRFAREERERDLGDLDEVTRALQRLQHMVTELLDVGRIDQGIFAVTPQTVDLVAIAEEVVAGFRSVRPAIRTRLPDELQVQADPGRITQVLENLLGNAVTHTPEDVPILVGVGTEQRDDGTWAVVSVHDEGPGIPAGTAEGLFARFASGPHSAGLGIGLYLARQIAEAHGGTLTVESAPGKGTSFWLALPYAAPGTGQALP